jgi:hypothetical protein
MVDGRALSAFKERAKKRGGRTIEQLPINKWADQEYGFILEGSFIGVREGRKKRGSTMEPGHLLDIANKETGEVQTWGCPGILHARLVQNAVAEGDDLEIMLVGKVENQYGTESWDFVVNHYPPKE